jgi:hypothetical protein
MNVTASSLRVNLSQRIGKDIRVEIFQAIDGIESDDGKLKILGLRSQLIGEVAMIKKEIEKLRQGYFGGRIMVATRT